jgi:hypothetical protein
MLEDFATGLMAWDEADRGALALALFGSGFLVGLVLRTGSRRTLGPLPFLVVLALIATLNSLSPAIWQWEGSARASGLLWTLVALQFGGLAVVGCVYGIASHARSVDAFGSGRWAWLGIVPLANLYLWFKPPAVAKPVTTRRRIAEVVGVVAAISLLAASGTVSEIIDKRLDRDAAPSADIGSDQPDM